MEYDIQKTYRKKKCAKSLFLIELVIDLYFNVLKISYSIVVRPRPQK
jgi:hypothetical protein